MPQNEIKTIIGIAYKYVGCSLLMMKLDENAAKATRAHHIAFIASGRIDVVAVVVSRFFSSFFCVILALELAFCFYQK